MADAVTEVLDRIKEVRRGPVVVSIPANASPSRRRRLMAQGIARLLFP
jgi:hypothetical protein